MAISDYNTWNLENSLAGFLASTVIAAGWLVYWHARDAVEISGGQVYDRWSTLKATHLADATFAAALAASRGIMTIRGVAPANPTFIKRLTSEGLEGDDGLVNLPTMALEVLPAAQVRPWELGTPVHLRSRQALVFGYLRSRDEQVLLADLMHEALSEPVWLSVVDHEQGTGAVVGTVDAKEVRIDTDVVMDKTETEAFAVEVSCRLEYVV